MHERVAQLGHQVVEAGEPQQLLGDRGAPGASVPVSRDSSTVSGAGREGAGWGVRSEVVGGVMALRWLVGLLQNR